MLPRLSSLVLPLWVAVISVRGDLDIYVDGALASGWENWSWGTDINFAATDIYEGLSSLSATSQAWSALSLKLEGVFGNTYAGLKFDISGNNPPIQIYADSTGSGGQSPSIPLSAFSTSVSSTNWTTVVVNFANLPPGGGLLGNDTWDRLNWQALGDGATYHLDNVKLVSQITIPPVFLSAEPLGSDLIAVTTQGAVDLSTVKVKFNNVSISISSNWTYVPIDAPVASITYFQLSKALAPGALAIWAGSGANAVNFTYTLPALQYGSITVGKTVPISPLIYGVNFPTSASYIQHLGVTISRWGGNAVTAYNPFGDFTNAGNDWFFENRDGGSADSWLGWVSGAGSKTMLTVPALDWVSKDTTSYSYPKTVYPNQSKFDPYKPDAGSGVYPNGSWVPPPNPTNVYTPWNTTLAKKWLTGLVNKPSIVTIDNEIEIASSTHQDMHPAPMGYDEELSRVVTYATAAKSALPGVSVAAPSTCAWWFYWTSEIGYTDNAAHNNIDWLPWFLGQMKIKSTAAGTRLLDYLDIHYYYQADTSANDAAAKALRLRATRSLWDPAYIDESWAGSNVQNHQPNGGAIWLIPRMKALIAQYYPGTKLSISEWSSTADSDVTGGLVTVDQLGLYGAYGVDSATYWATPDEQGPVGTAFWLYRGYGTYFGDLSAQVNLASNLVQNVTGIFAGVNSTTKKLSVVINNKDTKPATWDISNIPNGKYLMRHFGGASGVFKWQTMYTFKDSRFIVVPAYTAVFLLQQ